MENRFNIISDRIFIQLNEGEYLTLSFSSENTQFIRFSQSKIRQTGLVDDATLELDLIFESLIFQQILFLITSQFRFQYA